MNDLAKEFDVFINNLHGWNPVGQNLMSRVSKFLHSAETLDDAEQGLLEASRGRRAWDVGSTKICLHAICLHCGKPFPYEYGGRCDDCTKPTIQERLRNGPEKHGNCYLLIMMQEAADEIDKLTKEIECGR